MAKEDKEVKEVKVSAVDSVAAELRRLKDAFVKHMCEHHDEETAGRVIVPLLTSLAVLVVAGFAYAAVTSEDGDIEYYENPGDGTGMTAVRSDGDIDTEGDLVVEGAATITGNSTVTGTLTTGGLRSSVGTGTAAAATVTAVVKGGDVWKQAVLTLADHVILIDGSSGVGFGATNLYAFPEGRIWVAGVVVENLILTPDGADLADGEGGDMSLGTVGTANATLDGTAVDLIAKTSTDPIHGTNDIALADNTAHFDGSSTAVNVALSWIADDADVATISTNTVNGIITITYALLGDY